MNESGSDDQESMETDAAIATPDVTHTPNVMPDLEVC